MQLARFFHSLNLFQPTENMQSLNLLFQSRSDGLPGNLKGNGLQTGGTLIVSKGGTKILIDYRQTNPADHVANSEILKALGIADVPEDNNTASNSEEK